MVINTADNLALDVVTPEEMSELYTLSDGLRSELNCVSGVQSYNTNRIDTLSDEIATIKDMLNRVIEMYGVVQLRCSDDSVGIPGNLSDLIG